MVDMKDLRVGDRVKIVDEWNELTYQNMSGKMDKWLGTVMTVKGIHDGFCVMEEDQNDRPGCPGFLHGWSWNKYCIDCVVPEGDGEFDVATDEELLAFLK